MKKYKGSCHCKAVSFEADAEINEIMECNCSHCDMKGFLLAFVPEENIKVEGEENLSEYKFNTGKISHKFCKNCGVQPVGSSDYNGKNMYMINARCIDDSEVRTLPIKHVDGKSL